MHTYHLKNPKSKLISRQNKPKKNIIPNIALQSRSNVKQCVLE